MVLSWHGGEGRTLCWSACCVATPWVRRFHRYRYHCTIGTRSAMINTYRRSTQNNKGKSSPPWITGDIMCMIRKKESVRRKLKHSSSTYLSAKFKQLRSMVKRMISDSRARFFESLEQDIKANPKRFWSIFKLGNKVSSIPEQMSVTSSSKKHGHGCHICSESSL